MSDGEIWMAEAAMWRILRRTLPAQRHEVLGALSALKLQLAVARRRLARAAEAGGAPAAAEDPGDRLIQLDGMAEQQMAAQSGLTEMRLWDGLVAQRHPLDTVIGQCVGWTRQAAAMRGHQLLDASLDGGLAPHALATDAGSNASLPLVQVPAAHYLLLALVYEVLDRLDSPSQLQLRVSDRGRRLRVTLEVEARRDPAGVPSLPMAVDAAGTLAAPAGQSTPHIDAGLVQALCARLSDADGRWRWLAQEALAASAASALDLELPA